MNQTFYCIASGSSNFFTKALRATLPAETGVRPGISERQETFLRRLLVPCTMHKVLIPLTIVAALMTACQQQSPPAPNVQSTDTTPPVITITGGNSQIQMEPQIPGNGVWINPSATAIDNVDGNISANIAITGLVDPNTLGFDTLYYSVSDVAGNNAIDTLVVEITPFSTHLAPYLGGVYNAIDTCAVIGSYTYPSTWTCDPTINNKVTINNFGAFGTAINVDCFVNPTTQTLSFNCPFSLGPSYANGLSATGSYTHAGNSVHVSLQYLWSDSVNTENCVSHYMK